MDCIFCKIIKGEIPSAKIWEDEYAFVFLDISPLSEGHSLVIPKKHFEGIFDADEIILQKIILAGKKTAGLLREKLGARAVNLINSSGKEADQGVFHFHLHVIPRYEKDGLRLYEWWRSKVLKSSAEDLKQIADKIRGEAG